MGEVIQLTRTHHQHIIELFGANIENYHFIMNDLITYDYQVDRIKVFGEYENGRLVSFILNADGNVTYYSPETRDAGNYRDLIDVLSVYKLSGPSRCMEALIPLVEVKKKVVSYLGVIKCVTAKRRHGHLDVKFIHTKEELGMEYELLREWYDLGLHSVSKSDYIKRESLRLQKPGSRTVYLSVNHKMAASASAVKEGPNSAIVTGVYTHPEYRGRGYGTEVLICIFNMLLSEGKLPFLFYNNPAAGSVYENLGMTQVCEWLVMEV
ncbi:GNAT family N-acetyltransferase [Peribacillus sp. SCS-37]|uniref:GNAT family N-acetyltransferase n=1 Tax=Paraperibacillus esterisolvens TaxID=3115296 RepID=UPI00390682F6